MKLPTCLLSLCVLLGACDGATPSANAGAPPARPTLEVCVGAPSPPAGAPAGWRHERSALVAMGGPEHTSQDTLATTTHPTRIEGKFAYGVLSKDLEDERVEVFIDDCSGAYRRLGEALTDSDGRVSYEVAAADLPAPGTYGVYLRVAGDRTSARSTLRVYPPGTKLVVFDIDGTLTTKDAEIFEDAIADFFEPIARGDVVPEARAKAREVTQARAAQGYPLVYLTGRPYLLTRLTREWLTTQGFAPGTLRVTSSSREVLPSASGVGAFKRGYLRRLTALGFTVEAAYGNAPTDAFAYAGAGVDPARTFIAGEHGGEGGTQAIGEDYAAHLPAAQAEPAPTQPFAAP
jgi:phosphatidate phosphatase PAH1